MNHVFSRNPLRFSHVSISNQRSCLRTLNTRSTKREETCMKSTVPDAYSSLQFHSLFILDFQTLSSRTVPFLRQLHILVHTKQLPNRPLILSPLPILREGNNNIFEVLSKIILPLECRVARCCEYTHSRDRDIHDLADVCWRNHLLHLLNEFGIH